ncbi:MAG: DUF2085 domain-containing protein [Acidobacteriia bacterium]|nr:DUF2085 domain-containing protein [Terriglobia bacterium]
MNFLRQFFSHICGQQHCWVLGGVSLPFCQRCTGLYVGAFFALVFVLMFRPRPSAFLYWIHGLFMLAMIPFGFHLVMHGAMARTVTGVLFAFGLVYYLLLNPLTAWHSWSRDSRERTGTYLLTLGITTLLLPMIVPWGGRTSAYVLTGLGVLGFAGLCCCVVVNLAVLPSTLWAMLRHSAEPSR